MVDIDLKLPIEILSIIFKELLPQDLINCSRTCWIWNTMANPFLYETAYMPSETKYERFLESIAPCSCENHDGSCVRQACNRRRQLGHLVKAVDIDIDLSELYEETLDDSGVTLLLELASATPNAHTVKIYMPIVEGELRNGPYFDWSILAARWTKLTRLTLRGPAFWPLAQEELTNFSDILSRIQHLEVTTCEKGVAYMLPFLPAKPYLQSLMVNVSNWGDDTALMKISQTCRNTLHTFMIYIDMPDIDLDDFNIASKLITTVGVKNYVCDFNITNFGDNLEKLEWVQQEWWTNFPNRYNSIIQAMKKTNKLRTLSLVGRMTLEYMPLVLMANKSTLHTFYFRAESPEENESVIPHLLANKVQLCNVTTLFFDFATLNHFDVHSLAEIFPNVGFLGLKRSTDLQVVPNFHEHHRMSVPSKWITTDDLSHFRHLKAIDEITYSKVIDQNEVTYQKCIIPWDKFWEPPSKKTTVF